MDLAFLLLIAVTQVGVHESPPLELGELAIAEIDTGAASSLPPNPQRLWQLRVQSPGAATPERFELARHGDGSESLSAIELRVRLEGIRSEHLPRPLLAAHENSLSRDLLQAVGLLEELWPGGARTLIAPVSAGPP